MNSLSASHCIHILAKQQVGLLHTHGCVQFALFLGGYSQAGQGAGFISCCILGVYVCEGLRIMADAAQIRAQSLSVKKDGHCVGVLCGKNAMLLDKVAVLGYSVSFLRDTVGLIYVNDAVLRDKVIVLRYRYTELRHSEGVPVVNDCIPRNNDAIPRNEVPVQRDKVPMQRYGVFVPCYSVMVCIVRLSGRAYIVLVPTGSSRPYAPAANQPNRYKKPRSDTTHCMPANPAVPQTIKKTKTKIKTKTNKTHST